MTRNIPGRGRYPAKRAADVRPGDVVVGILGRSRVESVKVGMKVVWLRLRGIDIDYSINVWRRRGKWMAVAG